MNVVFYTPFLTPHQLPWCREFADILSECEFYYIYTNSFDINSGWKSRQKDSWILDGNHNLERTTELLKNADVLITGFRDLDLFRSRTRAGFMTIYSAERWFKPPVGMLRLLHPTYAKVAFSIMKLWWHDKDFHLFPIGVHAKNDFLRLNALMRLNLRSLFKTSRGGYEHRAGGRVWDVNGKELERMRMWGYFVSPSKLVDEVNGNGYNKCDALPAEKSDGSLRLLWCGRLLGLKRVGDIVRAVGEHVGLKRVGDSLPKISLTIVGDGPEKDNLIKLVHKLGLENQVRFLPPMSNDKVRELMREHDIYVLPSNGYEGWGAVVSEALEEGMDVIGTYEAGSTATILDESSLYHAGDYKKLASILRERLKGRIRINGWSAKDAANTLKNYIERFCS